MRQFATARAPLSAKCLGNPARAVQWPSFHFPLTFRNWFPRTYVHSSLTNPSFHTQALSISLSYPWSPIGRFFHVFSFLKLSKDSHFYSRVTFVQLTAYFISQTLLAKFLSSDFSNIPLSDLILLSSHNLLLTLSVPHAEFRSVWQSC